MAIHTTPDSYTKLLIHSNTSDGSTTFVDSSLSGHTISVSGNPTHEDTQKKFGATAMYFDGDDRLGIAEHSEFDFGTGDFTIDFWIWPDSDCFDGSYDRYMLGASTDTDNDSSGYSQLNINLYHTNGWRAGDWYNLADSPGTTLTAGSGTPGDGNIPATEQWSHVALVKHGDNMTLFLNGKSVVTQTGFTSNDYDINATWYIGAYSNGSQGYWKGYMDEFRISKGIARWTDTFVPPNKPYSVVDDDFVTDVAGIEDDGSGNTTFGRDIIVKSNPDEASTDTVFSVQDKVGIERLGVKANGVLYNESSIASTTPRVIMGDGWLSGDWPASGKGTYFQGYQEVTSGNSIIVGTAQYSTGILDGQVVGTLEVNYTAAEDPNRSGYYKFRIGYTANSNTTTVHSATQNSSCTCVKANSGNQLQLTVTPTTTGSQNVKVFYIFSGIVADEI
jgi:hypothetical protein